MDSYSPALHATYLNSMPMLKKAFAKGSYGLNVPKPTPVPFNELEKVNVDFTACIGE